MESKIQMNKIMVFSMVLVMLLLTSGLTVAEKVKNGEIAGQCTTIQDGILLTSDGEIITTGFDEWGYNYQGRTFSGMYCDAYRDAAWCQPYKDVKLQMDWNDAWLSNKDCDNDGLLDRHYGYESYVDSGAWETNYQSGEYEQEGEVCKWNYFVKIVAVSEDAEEIEGVWYSADGTRIGEAIWGAFAIIQEIYNDPCEGFHGLQYISPAGPGFGMYNPKSTYTIIHYAEGYGIESKLEKSYGGTTEEEGCYKVISKDMEWWTQPNYVINPTNNEGLSEDFVVEAINKAIYEWDYPSLGGNFDIFGIPAVNTEYPTGLIGDGVNAISFGNYDATGVIAVTSVWGIFRGPPATRYITEFDVMFDTDFDWADCTAEEVDCISEKKMDLQNIATHELGHAVGLADLYTTDCNQETMYGFGNYGEIYARDLYYGDIAGLNLLYN